MRKVFLSATVSMLCLAVTAPVFARGGGGGGGRGAGGGGPRGGFGSESRGGDFRGDDFRGNEFRGSDFQNGVGPGSRGLADGLGRGAAERPQIIHPDADSNRAPSRDNLQRFLGLPAGGEAGRATNQAAAGRPNKADNPTERNAQRDERHDEINRQLADRRDDFNRFDRRWWGAPGWGALAGWGAFGWGDPIPYNYGDSVYYDNGTVYSDGEPVASSEDYAQQASDIAQDGADADTEKGQWMSLGVFALSMDGQAKGPAPTVFVQLAVSKDGTIAGTMIDTTKDGKQSLEGSVDRKSQRAAWTVAGQKWPVFEAGIYNLTEKTAPMLVHYADGQTQQRLLVRVDKPAGGDEAKSDPKAVE